MARYPGIALSGNQVVLNVPVPAQVTMVSVAPTQVNYMELGPQAIYTGGVIPMAVAGKW